MDERGVHLSKIGSGFSGMKVKQLSPKVKQWMDRQGIRFTQKGDSIDTLSWHRGGRQKGSSVISL